MQNYPLSLYFWPLSEFIRPVYRETLGKFEISELEAHLFLILKALQGNFPDFQVLLTAFDEFFSEGEPGQDPCRKTPFLDCNLAEITEITPIFAEKIKHIFVINCSYFLNHSLNDETLFPLFRVIIEGIKEFNYGLLELNVDVFLSVLREKKYDILKFLIEKREIRLSIPDDREIATLLPPNNYNDINKSKSFKKTLANHAKIDLQLVALYYISENPEHYIVK